MGCACVFYSPASLPFHSPSLLSPQVKHVFRLLRDALSRGRGVEWVLLENVEALLDRGRGPAGAGPTAGTGADAPPGVAWLAEQFEGLGYASWAHRVVNAAGEKGGRRGETGGGSAFRW